MSLRVLWAVDVSQIVVTEASEQERHDCFKKLCLVFLRQTNDKKGLYTFFSPICPSQSLRVCVCVYVIEYV